MRPLSSAQPAHGAGVEVSSESALCIRPPPEPQLRLSFALRAGRTYLARQRATHPFHVGRALYRPDDPAGLATLYVQGCAGGVFEGDRLAIALQAQAGARAHVTTGAATLVHRMPNAGHAQQTATLELETGALLEYFPDSLILFPNSRLTTRLSVRAHASARLIAIDAFLGHRLPDDATPFDWLDSTFRIEDERGRLLARERFVAGGAALREQVSGISGAHACQGSVLVLGAESRALPSMRTALQGLGGVLAGVSVLPDDIGLFARVLATDGAALRRGLLRAWAAAREALGVEPGRARPK